MSIPRLTALLACPWVNPSANSSQSARVRSRSMRPRCSSQKPASLEHRHAAQLAVQQCGHRQGIRIGALSGDDDAPDALSPQRAGRQRLLRHAGAGILRCDHRLEQPAAPGSRQMSQPRDMRCRSKHQDPPDEPTFAHDTVEHHPARQNADEPHQQHLAQQQHGMAVAIRYGSCRSPPARWERRAGRRHQR